MRLRRVLACASERVDAAPASADVEQLDLPDAGRDCRVDNEVVADWLEAEHGAQEEQRRARRPGLRTTGRRIFHRIIRLAALVAAECLGEAPIEERGGVEVTGGNQSGFVLEAVAAQAPGDE